MSADQESSGAQRRLTEEEKRRVDAWYEEHGEAVNREVRRWLRNKTAPVASRSQVAQSVWASFMDKHLDEVDVGDQNSASALLTKAAKRHCEKHNRRATRHPNVSGETFACGDTTSDERAGFDATDTRELAPEVAVLIQEFSQLFRSLEATPAGLAVRQALAVSGKGIGLVERLDGQEREVLGLKLAKWTRPEIARQLNLDEVEVDELWKSVKHKAQQLEGEEG
jgi:hypothetical protein